LERTITEPGSIIIQRGTIHQWINRGSTWTKIVFVIIDAIPVKVKDGEGKLVDLLEEFIFPNGGTSKA